MSFYRWQDDDLILVVHVQPRASQTSIILPLENNEVDDTRLKIRITAAPIDGKANEEVCKLLAKLFGVAKSQVTLVAGESSRDKRIRIKSPKKLPDFIQSSVTKS